MTRFLLTSLILTVVLNVGLRVFPGLSQRLTRWVQSLAEDDSPDPDPNHGGRSGVRVIVPWRAMLVGSIALTVLLNLIAVLR